MVGELNDILHDLEASLGPLEGAPAALDGGITNRNYRATLGGSDYVIRRPGKDTELLGIDRTAERLANGAAAELGIAPHIAASLEGCLVTCFVSCRPADATAAVEEIAHALRAFHESQLHLSTSFWVPDLLGEYAAIATRRGARLPPEYAQAVLSCARIEVALPLRDARPCHNDLLPGNMIRSDREQRIMIVDWEYAGMGDARFDLGNLSVNNDFDEQHDERLLTAYYGSPPSDARRAALKLMRVLSDAREAAWGVLQGVVSELEFDFAAYARRHFERLEAAVADPAFEEWLAAAGG